MKFKTIERSGEGARDPLRRLTFGVKYLEVRALGCVQFHNRIPKTGVTSGVSNNYRHLNWHRALQRVNTVDFHSLDDLKRRITA